MAKLDWEKAKRREKVGYSFSFPSYKLPSEKQLEKEQERNEMRSFLKDYKGSFSFLLRLKKDVLNKTFYPSDKQFNAFLKCKKIELTKQSTQVDSDLGEC